MGNKSKNKKRRDHDYSRGVRRAVERRESAMSSYGYLKLPKGITMFKPKPDSRAYLDFIPYEVTEPRHPARDPELDEAVVGTNYWARPFKIHKKIGVDEESVVCPTSIGKKCPICEDLSRLYSENASKEETKPLKPSDRELYAVIPKGHKDYEEELHLFEISYHLFRKQLDGKLKDKPENEVFPNIKNGKTLRIRFDSATIGNSKPYSETGDIDFEKRDYIIEDDILDAVPKLDDLLTILSYEELYAKYNDEEASTSDDDYEKPEKRKKKNADKKDKKKKKDKSGKKDKKEKKKDKKGKKKGKSIDGECPHGHTFAVDCEDTKHCAKCEVWDKCSAAQEALKKKK